MLPACDAAVLSRDEVAAVFAAAVAGLNPSMIRAATQDMAMSIREWGFALDEIDVPIHIWHGDLDRNVPLSHGRTQATGLRDATFHLCPGEGHWLVFDHMPEILATVTGSSERDANSQPNPAP